MVQVFADYESNVVQKWKNVNFNIMMFDGEHPVIEICLVDATHNTIQDALASFFFFPTMATNELDRLQWKGSWGWICMWMAVPSKPSVTLLQKHRL